MEYIQEFARSYDQDDFFIVPNALMSLPQVVVDPNNRQKMMTYVPESETMMSQSMARKHGSCVASLTTGVSYGIAKRAHMVPVKYKNRSIRRA